MRTLIAALIGLLAAPAQALAHGSAGHETGPAWTFDVWIVTPLLISGVMYVAGATALWRRAGAGRGIQPWEAAAYGAGWLMLAAALVSPLHWLGERLFTAHMIEHEIIMAVAAPLIAVARPLGAFMWALPKSLRTAFRRLFKSGAFSVLWRGLTVPLNATILHGIAIWIWHAPALFDAAVTDVAVHRLQHGSFLGSALLFWWALMRRCDYGAAAGHLFVTMLHTTLLGALMALAPRVLYRAQTAGSLQWGLSPLQDQQLAGIVMWVPAGTVYAGAVLAFAALWIRQSSQGASRRLRGQAP